MKPLPQPRALHVADTGAFANSSLPVLVYPAVLAAESDLASAFERLFECHGWTGSWRNGLYRQHHYHASAHEALGVYRGSVQVRLGGPEGELLTLVAGDVLVIPAGVAHKNEGQSLDFAVVGAYPTGTAPDMQYGRSGERPHVDRIIAAVPKPALDPVGGALPRSWVS